MIPLDGTLQERVHKHQARRQHWLERCTLGVNEAAFERWQSQGSDKWLDGQLKTTHPLPPEIQQRVDALDISQQSLQRILAHASALKAAIDAAQTDEAREAARKSQREYENGIVQDAMRRNLWRAVYSQDSLRERMTWFWFNHFNVFSGKANLRYLIPDYEENAIRPHALGKFSELVLATLKHPVMLVYLDNAQNAAGKINENYARELMELHTLGVNAGYTQQDVQELARILTGVGVNFAGKPKPAAKLTGYILDGAFEFNPRRHDTGDKVLLGHKFHGAGFNEVEQAVKLLCRQSATAKHISAQMAAYFLGKEPAAPLVNAMAATFQKSDGDIAATLKVLLTSQLLQQNAGSFKDPYRYVVAALRQGYEGRIISNMKPAINWLNQMGEPLYGKLTPDGYASMPLHGSLSRKLRKGIKVQVNEGKIYAEATLFLGEEFLRISEEEDPAGAINTYYDWKMVASVRTYSERDEDSKPKPRRQKV